MVMIVQLITNYIGFDCGVYICKFTECYCNDMDIDFNDVVINEMRSNMLAHILSLK